MNALFQCMFGEDPGPIDDGVTDPDPNEPPGGFFNGQLPCLGDQPFDFNDPASRYFGLWDPAPDQDDSWKKNIKMGNGPMDWKHHGLWDPVPDEVKITSATGTVGCVDSSGEPPEQEVEGP
jgi:hypothetical protein